jgi:hypothetical protein
MQDNELQALVESAKILWGEPTKTTTRELRFGNEGSKSVNLEKLTWFDHEENLGGGWVALAKKAGYQLKNGYSGPNLVDAYIYKDKSGRKRQEVVKLVINGKKSFRQSHFVGDSKVSGLGDIERIPYNLDQFDKYQSARIFIVEGEKDANTLTALGFLATTNSGGAKNWSESFSQYFVGRNVVIIPDNDDAGMAHAKVVSENLLGVAAEVRIIKLDGLDAKGDVSDWFAKGHTADELKELVLNTPALDIPLPLGAVDVSTFLSEYQETNYIVDGIIEEGRLYSLTAPSGTGKTAVALLMAERIALGLPFGGNHVEKAGVIFLAGENPSDVRIRMMAQIEKNPDLAKAPIYFVKNSFDVEANLAQIRELLDQKPEIRVLFVDTLQAFFVGDDFSNNNQMVNFAKVLRQIAEWGIAVVTLAHPTKAPTKERNEPFGGGSFVNEIDGNLALWKNEDDSIEFYWCKKFRGAFEPFSLELKKVEVDGTQNAKGIKRETILAMDITEEREREMYVKSKTDDMVALEALNGKMIHNMTELAKRLHWVDKAGKPQKMRAKRVLERLLKAQLITENIHGIAICKNGKIKLESERFGDAF